jgi:hypothetical protein
MWFFVLGDAVVLKTNPPPSFLQSCKTSRSAVDNSHQPSFSSIAAILNIIYMQN